jgi:hypothetical protein
VFLRAIVQPWIARDNGARLLSLPSEIVVRCAVSRMKRSVKITNVAPISEIANWMQSRPLAMEIAVQWLIRVVYARED